jgi:ribosomal protein S17E
MHPSNISDSDTASEHRVILEPDSSFENEPIEHDDQQIHDFLEKITGDVLYCIDAILTRHGSHSEEYNHRLAFNRFDDKFILCVLTAMPDWSRKTYVWYFPMPSIDNTEDDEPIMGTWSTFDFDFVGCNLAQASSAFQMSTDYEGFEIDSGVDAEGTSIVTLTRRGSQWFVNTEVMFGAQGPKSRVCELCLHRLDCPCFSPCGGRPSEESIRKRRLRIEMSAAPQAWVPIPDQMPKKLKGKQKGKFRDLEREKIVSLKKSFYSLPKDFKERSARVMADDDLPGEGLHGESFSDFISPGCRVIKSSTLSVSSNSSKSRVPSPLCRTMAGSSHKTPPRNPGKNYEATRLALASLKIENSEEEMFFPQVSWSSLLNLNVHHEIGDGVSDAIDNLASVFTKISDKIPTSGDVKETVKGLKDDIKGLLKNTMIVGIPILVICFCGYRLIVAIKERRRGGILKWSLITISLIAFLIDFVPRFSDVAIKVHLMAIMDLCKKISGDRHEDPLDMEEVGDQEEEMLSPQNANDINTPLFASMSTLVLTFFSLQAVGDTPGPRRIDKFLNSVGAIPRATIGVSQIMDSVIEMVQHVINFVRTEILGLGALTWFEESFPEVDRWCRKVQTLADESRTSKWIINSLNSQRVYETFKEGNSLFLNKYKNVESTRVRNAIQAYMTVLRKLMVPFEQANISGIAPRMEPVTLFLGGAPGVGKSNITIPLLTEVIMEVLPEERRPELVLNYMDFIYNRQTEHQYWDRYYGQIACVFDDFLQKRDVAGTPDSETMDIIRGTNMFPNVLHMAALENKGTTVFTSRIIVCTSNTSTMKVESIQEPEALCRRFTHTYRVVPREAFCTVETMNERPENRRLNIEHPELVNPINKDAIEFEEMRWDHKHEAQPTGRKVSYTELVEILVRDYKVRSNKSDKYNALVTEGLRKKYAEMQKKSEAFRPQVGDDQEDDPIATGKLQEIIGQFDKAPRDEDDSDDESVYPDEVTAFEAEMQAAMEGLENPEIEPGSDYLHVIECLVNYQLTPFEIEEVSHVMSTVCTARFGSARTIWAFSEEAPQLWRRFLTSIGKTTDRFEGRSGPIHAEDIRRLERVITHELRSLLETRMFRLLSNHERDGVSDADVENLGKHRKTFSRFANFVKKGSCDFVQKHPFLTVLGSIASLLALWKTFSAVRKMFEDPEDEVFDPESGHARKGKNKQHKQRARRDHVPAEYFYNPQVGSSRIDMPPEAEEVWVRQGGGDLNAIQQAKRIVQKSTYGIIVPWAEARIGTILFIKGRIAIYPFHYVHYFENQVKIGVCTMDTEIQIKNDYLVQGYKLTVREFINVKSCPSLEKQDITVFIAPNRVHQHADITNMFATIQTLEKPLDLTSHLIILEDDRSWRINSGIVKPIRGHLVGESRDNCWRVDLGYLYPFPTLKGDCGSTLLLNNKSVTPGKIIGMHVAGNDKGRGLAAALNKELIEDVVKMFSIEERICAPVEVMLEPQLENKPFDANMVPLFKCDKPVSLAGKTKIIRSPLHGAWGPARTKPAYLRPRVVGDELVDPRMVGLSGYCAGNSRVDPTIVEAIVSGLSSHYVNIASRTERRKPIVFTFEQAVKGIEGHKYCDSIDRTTSPGYPWVLEKPPGFPGKTWWFGLDGEVDTETPQAKQVSAKVENIIAKAKEGIRLFHPYVDFPKDERRPIEKADAMKTRSISGCALDYSIAERMYFLDFSIFMMESRIDCNACIGINPRSQEWDVLARVLSRFPATVAGDFSGFDKTQIAEFLWAVLEIVNKWYNDGPENRLIRTVLWAEVVNSIHLFEGDFLQWIKSLPSGHPLTVIINSLVHIMYVQYCYVILHPQGLHGLQFFWELVEMQTYGDDGVYSISDTIIPWFNQITITEAMKTIGLTYTDENKSEVLVPFRRLSEVTFLKRGFRFDNMLGRYVAPLSLDTILEMPYWTKEGPAPLEITYDNVSTALMELSLHGEEKFLFHSQEIIDACRKKMNWLPPVTSYAMNLSVAMNTLEEW